ncbi:MAG: sugar ABC transporter substrate-binding protein [Firmicutes bacterium]|jgi:D-xylose transport system substrate-binding protein|nr:sugar ABC transporter substrate-binding protein [Bacillota bacterium]
MKKYSKVLALVLMVILVVPMMFGCGSKPAETSGDGGTEKMEKFVIGISLPTQREERWVKDKEAMEKYAAELGYEVKVQIADADQAQQAQQVENLLTQGIDVLILAPHDASASAELVKKAKEENVPVISYDRLVTSSEDLDYYLSFDNEAVGRLQGDYFTKNVENGTIMLFAGAPTDNNAKLFFNGAMSVIQPKIDSGDYTVIGGTDFQQVATDNWVPANAQNRASNILTANADATVAGVLAPNDGTAGGIIEAFKAAGLDVPVVTGQDSEVAAVKRIKIGEQSMTIFKDTRALAKAAIDMAVSLSNGEEIEANGAVDNGVKEVKSVLLEPVVVTQDNFQEVLVDSGYINEDDLK